MFVGRVVIADQIYFLVCGYGLIDQAQELEPLLMAVLLLAQAVDLAIGGVERGEQGGCAVPFVVMRHGGAATLLHRQARLGAIQRLYLALLVHTWKTYSTKQAYEIYLKRWILPKWRDWRLSQIKPIEVELWLKQLPLARGSRAKIRCLMIVL